MKTIKPCTIEVEETVEIDYGKRFSIKWTERAQEKLVGILTVDVWKGGWSPEGPTKSYTCECHVTQNSVGMSGIDGGTIPPLSEEEFETVHSLMRSYYAGFTGSTDIYCWALGETE